MTAKGSTTDIRRWFDEHGWQLEPAELRAALQERGANVDLIVELIDDGADRRRAVERDRPTPGPQPGRNGHRPQRDQPSGRDIVLPQNLEAEEALLGAAMLNVHVVARCRDIVSPDDFFRESHRKIWQAALALTDAGQGVDTVTLNAELERRGDLESIGGRVRLHELAALVFGTPNAPHYAKIVADNARLRTIIRVSGEASRAAFEGGDIADILDTTLTELRTVELTAEVGTPPEATGAGTFIFDEPDTVDEIRIWGDDTAIGWAAGEGFMLGGPDGVGKTTLGQQLAIARAGLRSHVLGMPVKADGRRVLYIAADRPRQAARSLRRMVTDNERGTLDDAMTVWRGPLPVMLNDDRKILARLAKQFDAGTVIIDSLKDVALDLASDEAGGRVATAFQHLIASGVELLVMHHPRKPDGSGTRKPRELADFYGSRLIFGVIGSAIMLWGEPGDVLIELRHLKQPIDELGPFNITHDHQRGHTTVEAGTDLLDVILRAGTSGMNAHEAAALVYMRDTPTRAEIHRIRARLDRLADKDKLVKIPSITGGETRYFYNGPAEMLT